MEVERLTAVLEASGLGTFNAQMQAADRVTGGTKDSLRALAEVSKIATEALSRVKMTAAQAVESKASAESIVSGVKGISEEARQAARELDRVHLSQAQAAETRIAADEQVRSLKQVEHQAIRTRAATGGAGGGGGGGGLGVGLLGAGIGLAGVATPALGPGAFGLLATLPAAVTGMVGTVGTLALAFDGVSKAIGGNLKAFKDLQPAAQQFVLTVRSLDGWFDKLRQTAGKALFPGLTAGLKAALSPGTVQQITTAVGEFGKAIGEAGQQWGRYFGSSQFQMIFGPLMAAGAQNLGKMTDMALRLFDALGVLGRAAIPLVNWMTNGADAAAKWIDNFTRAKDATGGLSGAMNQAKQSLRLVGGLVAALAKTIYDLGAALYPVSKVALRDLTAGLSAVDGWLKRNRQTITEVAGVIVNDFAAGIVAATKAVGAFYSSMKHDLGSNGAKGVVIALGAAIAIAFGGWPAIIAASVVAVGAIIRNWTTIKDFFKTFGQWILNAFDFVWVELQRGAIKAALNMVEPFSHLPGFLGGWARKAKNSMQSELDKLKPPDMSWGRAAFQAGTDTATAWMQGFAQVQNQGGVMLRKGGQYVPPVAGNTNPVPGAAFGRIDQGVDYVAKSNVLAARAGVITSITKGMAGGTGDIIKEKLAKPVTVNGHTYYGIYYSERSPLVKRGQAVGPGTPVMAPGSNEIGFLDANMQMTQLIGGLGAGTQPTGAGADFNAFVRGLGGTAGANPSPGGTNPFGTPPPFTSGLGTKPPKPPVIPALVTHLLSLAGTNAANASALSNTGGTAKRYLEYELMDLDAAHKKLEAAFEKAHGKAKTQLDKAAHSVEDKIIAVQALIKKAIIVTGDALLPDKLKAKLQKLSAQGVADADYAAVLTGQTADDYQKTIRKNLLSQAAVIQAEVASLKARLANASGKQKAAIQTELAKVQGALESVQQSILSNLQQTVQTLQGRVSSLFQSVQASLVTQLGNQYFQNGLQTPSEALLSSMQAQDQMNSLTDALQAAKDQRSKDQNTLSSVVYEMTTGKTTYNYSSAAQQQLAADQKAVEAAQRQLDEYNLSIKAAQERQSADRTYSAQLDKLNKQLGPLADAFQNGTGSISALREVAKQFGLQITDVNTPDFNDLSTASNGLKQAFKDLADYIAKITGATPKIPTVPNTVAALNSQALVAAQSSGNLADTIQAARDAGYTQSVGYLGRAGLLPGYADGGPVPHDQVAQVHGGEYVVPRGGALVKSGGGGGVVVNLSVSALDPASVDWAAISEKIRAEFLRTQRRNGGTTGIK